MPKPSIAPVRWQPPGVRELSLAPQPMPELSVIALPGHGPEDVVADAQGNIWTGVVDGRILRIRPSDGDIAGFATTEHPPLGMHVSHDGRILICCRDKLLALDPDSGDIEPVVTEVDGPPLIFCSNVTESSDGTIYFSESTARFPFEEYRAAAIEGRGTGRVFRRDTDGTVTTIADGLHFTNGVTLTSDESELVFAETTGRRLTKIALTGPRQGTFTRLVEELPCMPDNISTGADGRIWVAMAGPRNAALEALVPKAPWLRKLIWTLPEAIQPTVAPDAWVVAFDPMSGEPLVNIRGTDSRFRTSTGVVESGGLLWLGCIGSAAVAHLDMAVIAKI